jgi:hypothetical protein
MNVCRAWNSQSSYHSTLLGVSRIKSVSWLEILALNFPSTTVPRSFLCHTSRTATFLPLPPSPTAERHTPTVLLSVPRLVSAAATEPSLILRTQISSSNGAIVQLQRC